MPLSKSQVTLQFSGGVERKQDPKQVPATKLLDLQNAVFTRETTLSKRNGYEALGRLIEGEDSAYDDVRALTQRGDELLLFTDQRCYSYRDSSDNWADAGEISSVVAEIDPIARTGNQQWIMDSATRNGVTALAWEENFQGGLYMQVVEEASKRVLLATTLLSTTGQAPRCVQCGENVLVLYIEPATHYIMAVVVNPAEPMTTPVPVILTDDLSSNAVYDAAPTLGGYDAALTVLGFSTMRPAMIAWPTGLGLRISYLHPSGALGAPANGLPSAATFTATEDQCTGPIAIAPCYDGFASAVVLGTTDGIGTKTLRVRFITEAFADERSGALGDPVVGTFLRCTAEFGATDPTSASPQLVWAVELQGTSSDRNIVRVGTSQQSDDSNDQFYGDIRGHVLVARAFHDGVELTAVTSGMDGNVYLTIAHAVQQFPYVAVVRVPTLASPGLISTALTSLNAITVARMLTAGDLAAGALFRATDALGAREYIRHLPSVAAMGIADTQVYTRAHRIPLMYRVQLASEDGDQFGETGCKLALLDFNHAAAYQSAELGRGLYLGGALHQHYDGSRWAEADYHTAPDVGYDTAGAPVDWDTAALVEVATGDIAAGTYLYKFWYEDIDAQGELHRGPVSRAATIVVANPNARVRCFVPLYRLTRRNNVRIGVARSTANATGTDETIEFFRVTSIDASVTTGSNCFVTNATAGAADTVTFNDGLSDAELRKREPLYTNGGILSNDPAPSSGHALVAGKSRLFWTDPSDPNLVRFSQQIADDTGVECAVDLSTRVDPFGGRVTALGILDDAVIVFKETAIHFFSGPGPLADPFSAPETNSFTPPTLVTSDVGCSSPQSIGQMPLGLMFQSSKAIMLIDRNRQTVLIGGPVEPLSSAQVITRTTLLPDRHQIVMLSSTGRTLLYDYEHNQWSTFTNHLGLGAVVLEGVYHYLRTDGRVFAETPGAYADDNMHIPMVIETAWIKMAGYLQGWQKVIHAMFVGAWISPHALRVSYRYDYQEAYESFPDVDVDADYDPSRYGDGNYGDGEYGGAVAPTTVYQQRFHLNLRCQAITFRVEDIEATEDFGAAFELSELLLTGGVLRGSFQVGNERSQ